MFFHFGIRTFYQNNEDWDEKPMDASVFNPSRLDCRQWMRIIKEAGEKYCVLTCKHHDGLANWPSKYTEYSVKNTPWKKLRERFQNAIDCKITAEGDEFFIELDKEEKVNCIVLEEDLTAGESVTQFEIMQATPAYVSLYIGKNIGHKRICTFPKTFGDRFKIKISGHNGDFRLKSIKLFNIL